MQVLTYKFRLLPTRRQHRALAAVLESQRQLYNAALEERIECYRKSGRSLNYIDQFKSLTECRRAIPAMAALPVNIQRGTLRRLDEAFRAFFRRAKSGATPGFPRFRGKGWFDSFEFQEPDGIRFDGKYVRFKGMPSGLRVHMHRPMPSGQLLSVKIKRDPKGWSVCFVQRESTPAKRLVALKIGIDVGIKTLAATSDGILIPNPRVARRADRAMRRAQRHLARCKRGSKGRQKARQRVARIHTKIANTRAAALHQISAMLVNRYDLIAAESLNIKGLCRTMLARDIHDASWAKLRDLLRYKAERAGAHFIEVDPKFTSQTCPDCGAVAKKTLAEREHSCPCGCVLDRDVAAAKVILSRAGKGPGVLNVADCSERAPRSISTGACYASSI